MNIKQNLSIVKHKDFYTLKSFDFELSTNNIELMSQFIKEWYGVNI